jgi:hypothetical protein
VSNDQSPPARKVIPYKKGGQRKSPFADMAFEFSGTALDVAIQQREERVEDASAEISETPARELLEDEPGSTNEPAPEVAAPQAVNDEPAETPRPPAVMAEQAPSPSRPAVARPQTRQRIHSARDVRHLADKRSGPAASGETQPQLRDFLTRWKPFLTETQLGICKHVYNNSVAVGLEYCFTSTAKLMTAVSKTERQVKTVVNQLMDWGFLVKGETVVNVPREERGTYYKLILDKS